MEKNISINADGIALEGLFQSGPGDKGVVVTHPHPLYGGDMYNPVVQAIIKAYRGKGYSTLRFNFRGTGNSAGQFDNGDGEQKDVRAALHYMRDKGLGTLCVSGYSFGAWVNATALHSSDEIEEMTMVSPPVAFIDFDAIQPAPTLKLIVCGSLDDIGPPAAVQTWLGRSDTRAVIEIIDGADHFFSGHTAALESILKHYIT